MDDFAIDEVEVVHLIYEYYILLLNFVDFGFFWPAIIIIILYLLPLTSIDFTLA